MKAIKAGAVIKEECTTPVKQEVKQEREYTTPVKREMKQEPRAEDIPSSSSGWTRRAGTQEGTTGNNNEQGKGREEA